MKKMSLMVVLLTLCLCACQKEPKQVNVSQKSNNQSSDYIKMSAEEREKRCLSKEDGYKMDEIFYKSSSEDSSSKIQKENSFDIDTTECKQYQEKRYGTSKVSGAVKGYIDSENHFSVKYISNSSSNTMVNGSFYDGIWHTSEKEISNPNMECEFGDKGETYELIGKEFDSLDKIVVKDNSGKTMYQINMKKFAKDYHLKSIVKSCSILGDSKCLLYCKKKNREAVCFVDLKKEKIIKYYKKKKDFEFADGIAYGDNYFYVLKDNYIEMYSMKDGKMFQTIDIGNLVENHYYGTLYEFDKEENEYTSFGNCYTDIKLSVDKDTVYIGTCTGVYKWKEGEKIFHKILDASNTKYYKKMIGTIKVARDGTIYCLGISKPHLGEEYESGNDELLVLS